MWENEFSAELREVSFYDTRKNCIGSFSKLKENQSRQDKYWSARETWISNGYQGFEKFLRTLRILSMVHREFLTDRESPNKFACQRPRIHFYGGMHKDF
jgi:hypothetical protein